MSAERSQPPRLIAHTDQPMRCAWPEGMLVQGGSRGVVFVNEGRHAYVTAFVEAFPEGTFLRGEGQTIAEAEQDCFAQFEVFVACEHGPFDARHYRNGAGFCRRCGLWMSDVLPVQPEDPDRKPSAFERAFLSEAAARGLLTQFVDAQARHDAQRADTEPSGQES